MKKNLSVVILAAGKGTRMKSNKAKVLHEVFFLPMIHHVLTAVEPLQAGRTVVIVGHQRQAVSAAIAGFKTETVVQEEQLGTGHAVLLTEKVIPAGTGDVMILCGDTPLLRPESLTAMLAQHRASGAGAHGAVCTLMTAHVADPYGYGRVLTTTDGEVIGIVEEKDGTPEEKVIKIINTGIYLIKRDALFTALASVDRNNAQGEFYLTDIIEKLVISNQKVCQFITPDPDEVLGVNSRLELALAHAEIQRRRNQALMLAGVSMESPESIVVALSAKVESDCLLEPSVRLLGTTRLGRGCRVGQGAILTNCRIDASCEIGPYSCLTGVTLTAASVIPPLTCR
ncbi:MAG: NTP transferase domain-containing protein [Desulfobulbaceae bacterium]|jgi:bifunctional UDP-N-acetylglucosamine pyrophosphorylase/glucosamine-1-phosphate N-acetyltransferase|nr:NTP transferase domain-containing protein [Desulfobulbaceae bacterium]